MTTVPLRHTGTGTVLQPENARLALVEGDAKHARTMSMILRSAARDVTVFDNLEDAALDSDLLVASLDALRASPESVRARLAAKMDGHVLTYSAGLKREDWVFLFGSLGLTNLLARNDEEVNGAELLVTLRKILTGEIFGIEKYFPWGTKTTSVTVRNSRDVPQVVELVREVSRDAGVRSRILESFVTAADELTSNAVYNAPVDAGGTPRFASQSRTEEVQLADDEAIIVTVCNDGRRVGISVSDPFGSLHANTVLEYLTKCFRGGSGQVDQKLGGAGLGLYYTFEALSQFVINLRPRERTEMIGIIDISGSYRDFVQRAKSFNMFVDV